MKKIRKDNPNTPEMWDHAYKEFDGGNHNEPRFMAMLALVEDGTRVVDLGCGQGTFLYALSRLWVNVELWGVDISRKAIEWAQNRIGDRVRFEKADVTDTHLIGDHFDYVVASEIMEHLDRPEDLIKEAYRLLKPGGKLILTVPFEDRIPSSDHVWEFNYKDIEKMMGRFSKSWVFPFASGGGVLHKKEYVHRPGNWNLIFCLAIK